MRKQFEQAITIPEGVQIRKDGKFIFVKGAHGEISKEMNFRKLKTESKDGKFIISHASSTRNEKRMINTITAHVKNMIKGVKDKFEYKLKVCSSHFPINVEIKGNEVFIKNFLGEKTPRKCKIPKGAEVEINKDIITVKSASKETAGQASANFEAATKVRNRDRRVFQDGIFITSKNGKEI
jgi:large subunit ribosomal protein L6